MVDGGGQPQNWAERQERLRDLARRQIFFVGGAPRSGTTWLQYLLDSHPDMCCCGEGLFRDHLAEPLAAAMTARRAALHAKNTSVFRHGTGFPLPQTADGEHLLATAILLALDQCCAGRPCRALGEKTPENVFQFPQLKRLFAGAKMICMARDPRDALSSAWHFFQKASQGSDAEAPKTAFVRAAIPGLQAGARAILALARDYPDDCRLVTYERLSAAPAETAAGLFRFLGVSDDNAIVAGCVAQTSFAALTAGRPAGVVQDGSFFRKGVAGDWTSTFTPALGEVIMQELGWMFPHFGWQR